VLELRDEGVAIRVNQVWVRDQQPAIDQEGRKNVASNEGLNCGWADVKDVCGICERDRHPPVD
jgi:hypothetical protein